MTAWRNTGSRPARGGDAFHLTIPMLETERHLTRASHARNLDPLAGFLASEPSRFVGATGLVCRHPAPEALA